MATVTGQDLVDELRNFLGVPYVYGGTTPAGFDCSGLIQYAYEKLGVGNFPRTSEDQYASKWFTPVSKAQLQPGDLIFSQWPGDSSSPGHVAVYSGGGHLIEAPRPGKDVQEVAYDSDYQSHTVGYRRFTGPGSGLSAAQVQAIIKAGGSVVQHVADNPLDQAAAGITDVASALGGVGTFFGALMLPQTWVRITCAVLGLAAVGFGAYFLVQDAGAGGTGHG